MTTFRDGPAKGVKLMLRRAPIMLRVVQKDGDALFAGTAVGEIDALDQPDDKPEWGETVHVYMMIKGTETSMHLLCRGKGKAAGGWYAGGEYRYLDPQPPEHEIRDNDAWARWCAANEADLMVQFGEPPL